MCYMCPNSPIIWFRSVACWIIVIFQSIFLVILVIYTGQVLIEDDWQGWKSLRHVSSRVSYCCSRKERIVCSVSIVTWHHHLGHLSHKRLTSMKSILGNLNSHVVPCHICPFAKQRRLSFPFNNHVAASTFDLVHCEIWGLFKEITHASFRYFMTIVDNCLRYTWTFLMRAKSKALSLVPRFFKLVETQFSKVIKVFRSDNASELKFTDFFTSTGTIH